MALGSVCVCARVCVDAHADMHALNNYQKALRFIPLVRSRQRTMKYKEPLSDEGGRFKVAALKRLFCKLTHQLSVETFIQSHSCVPSSLIITTNCHLFNFIHLARCANVIPFLFVMDYQRNLKGAISYNTRVWLHFEGGCRYGFTGSPYFNYNIDIFMFPGK